MRAPDFTSLTNKSAGNKFHQEHEIKGLVMSFLDIYGTLLTGPHWRDPHLKLLYVFFETKSDNLEGNHSDII